MSATLKRRGSLIAVLLLVLGLAAVLATASSRGATAQTPRDFFTFYFDDSATPTNGTEVLAYDFSDLGTNPVVESALCTGRSPRSGANIPAQVVTQITNGPGGAFTLRVLHNTGTPLTGSVTVNCIVGVTVDAAPVSAPTSITNKVTHTRVKVNAVKN